MSGRAIRILVAEDNVTMAGVIGFSLRHAGFEVTHAPCGQSAWDLARQERFDLIITDFQMPNMTGGQLCERIREVPELAEVPIILLTCKGYELDAVHYQGTLGVSRIMSKPFSPQALARTVQECLQAAGVATT
jgi:CheY-like chemotaxis protein